MIYSESLSGKNNESNVDILSITKNRLDQLKKDILKKDSTHKEDILESLENDPNITNKVGFVLSYNFDSHLLIGDRGFGILHIDTTSNHVDVDKSFRINPEIHTDTYNIMMNTLGNVYESFTIVNGDRIFSVDGMLKIDLSTKEIIFSSREDITEDMHTQLDNLGIQDHLVFYDKIFIEKVIQKRQQLNTILEMKNTGASETSIREAIARLTEGKPIVLSITPAKNTNQASKYNNMDILMNNYTILSFQIENESSFKKVLEQMMILKTYGVQIDNFYFQQHANKNKIFLSPKGHKDENMLSYDDFLDLIPYAKVFEGTHVMMDTCLTGKGLDKQNNITNFLTQSLFFQAKKVTSPTKSVYSIFIPPKEGEQANFDNFIYYEENADAQRGISKELPPQEVYTIYNE